MPNKKLIFIFLIAGLFGASANAVPKLHRKPLQKSTHSQFAEQRQMARQVEQNAQKRIYTKKELIELTTQHNYTVRNDAEKLIQANANVNMAISALLPSLNFGVALSAIYKERNDLLISSLGVAFPTNWFKLAGAKKEYEAERYSYGAMLGNQVSMVTNLFYSLHMLREMAEVFEEAIHSFEAVLENAQRVKKGQSIPAKEVKRLVSILALLEIDHHKLEEQVEETKDQMAFGVGLPYEEWHSFDIERLDMPSIADQEKLETIDDLEHVRKISLELKQLDYMIAAAKYAVLGRSFEFLSPDGDAAGSLGFGYASYIRTGRSQKRQLIIKREETNDQIAMDLEKITREINDTAEYYRQSTGVMDDADFVTTANGNTSEAFNAQQYVSAFKTLLELKLIKIDAHHENLIAKDQLDRIMLRGEFYETIMDRVPERTSSCSSSSSSPASSSSSCCGQK